MPEKSWSRIPRNVFAGSDHVVARQSADRNALHGRNAKMRRKRTKVALQAKKNVLAVIREIHFVDGGNDAANSEKRGDVSVAMRLGQQALCGIDQDNRNVSRGRAGGHVARVLFVTRSVRNDELPPRRAEVTVSDINRNSLLSLGTQTIRKQRKIERPAGTVDFAFLHRSDLIFVNGFRVMKQSSDQRGLAVVYAARRSESQKILAKICLKKPGQALGALGRCEGQH